MPSLTRRGVLAGAAALLAGCNGTSTEPPTERPRPEIVATDPPVHTLRSDGDETLVRDERETDDAEETTDPHPDPIVVDNSEAAEALSFADVDGVERAQQFLAETEFESESVVLLQDAVGECYAQEVCYVAWSATEVQVDSVRRYRDANVSCSTDAKDTIATFVRVPGALDADQMSSFSWSTGSGRCRVPPEWREIADGTASNAGYDE